jgi:hypothetical protein
MKTVLAALTTVGLLFGATMALAADPPGKQMKNESGPGASENAPTGDDTPSETTPGHQMQEETGPGASQYAPGQNEDDESPGASGEAPGHNK